ncbi:hypothetical protein TruAng_001467 [Truncatella angustata]|nr:hypothetical protein TruAng_001467 [Truncatella angustata]
MADVVNSEPSSENGNVLNEKVHDDTVVDWDGPDDINNPLNWSSLKRNAHVVLISIFTLYGNLASTMFAPGAAALVHEFGITSDVLAAFTVSIYLVGFALGPILISPLSEVCNFLRSLAHIFLGLDGDQNPFCNVIFLAFTIGCAVSTSSAMFFVFRFLAGCACSAPMTVGGAVIADITTPEQRGKAMALWALGPLLGPVVGPIIGGFVAQRLSWRWAFWIISILLTHHKAGVVFIVSIFVMKETNATILLQRKAAKLRRASGKTYLVAKGQINQTTKQILLRAILRPTRLLLFSPVVTLLSLFSALVFSLIYILFTTFPMVFETQWLAYLGLGIGLGIGIVGFGATSDRVYKRLKGDGEGTPEMRLPPMMWVSPITGLGFFWYGWSAQYQVHWIVPIIGSSVIGIGALFVMMPAQIYIVDAFGPQTAASALAASAVLRTLSGAFLTLAGPPISGYARKFVDAKNTGSSPNVIKAPFATSSNLPR